MKKPGIGGDAVWGQAQPEKTGAGIAIGAVPLEGGGAAVIAGRF